MPPTPQEPAQQDLPSGHRVVISGMSGLYPDSHNVEELADILYNKVNPIRTDHKRWWYNHPEASMHVGVAPELSRFDSQFFKVHRRMGLLMDPMSRKLLEESFKAIYDAGLSPEHLSNKRVGVYMGTGVSETEKSFAYDPTCRAGLGIAGCSRTMFANRISYWLNTKGPSLAIDQACCSSTAAIEEAYKAIKNGHCDAAIAGGASLCLHPQTSIHYGRLSKLSMDGKTKSYDQNAEGCARSEAVGVVFLQKSEDALRIYGEVVHIKNEFIGLKEGAIGPKFGFDRDPIDMAYFIRKFYDEAGIPPNVVEYVEGFGSADPEADRSELEALAAVFKRNENNPLLLGSVKSNIGYTEAASGVTAITKVLLGYHKGELAGNLNFETPRQDVPASCEGRLKVLNDHHKFRRTFTAVNGLSCTGVNSHVLLHGHFKPKDPKRYKSSIPRLVTLSGRMDKAVEKMVKKLKTSPVDPEQLALLHNIHSKAISGHLGRGYVVLDANAENETMSLSEKVDYFDDVKRPLVFVYSGMGSQWAGMGAQLMRIPIFAAAIGRCNRVLQPKGIDIVHVITSPEKDIFDNILHSFVGIAAVQIGLTDILQAIGLEPDFIIGHSVGELGCAYADGCFTAEEMILSAYSRGLVSVQTPFIKGSMAAIGIGYEKMKDMCPPEIEVACHNGPDSCTISGPQDVMKTFVEQLTANQIFAKEVPCSNIAYHSRYIAEAAPALRKYLCEVIDSPKARSKRWLSTSVPVDKWEDGAAKFSSAEYHTNNLLNPVLFEETSRLLPANGVMVEIAPHGLLQAILKKSMPSSCTQIAMTKRGHADNALLVLEAIGKLYIAGYVPQVSVLYPRVEFPVSTGTPFLSNLVHWMHSERWHLYLFMLAARTKTATCKFPVSVHDDDYSFLQGNVVRGKTLYPYSAALIAVWDTLAMSTGQKKKQVSVQFKDVQLYAQPILHDQKCSRIYVNLHRGNGMFEVLNGDSVVATGYIVGKIVPVKKNILNQIQEHEEKMHKSDGVYEVLEKRGYSYSGEFRSIYNISESYDKAHIMWKNNWTTFIDSLLQLYNLNHKYTGVSEPSLIRSLSINVKDHLKNSLHVDEMSMMEANFVREHDLLCCDGVMLEEVKFRDLSPVIKEVPPNEKPCIPGEESKDLTQKRNKESQTNLTLQCMSPGDLDSLSWIERPAMKGSGIPVTVHYCSLNHRDAMQAMGVSKYQGDCIRAYSMEFSGVTDRGERVMGLIPKGAASSRVLAIPELLWPVPEHWSLEDAATVPLAYSQALYCLFLKMNVIDIENLLVHCGTGALGQAVISIAHAHGVRVFTTVSSQEKKQFLLKLFPKLDAQDIGNSRDHTFADMILAHTKGTGCNVCFNCLEGALKDSTLRICRHHGLTFDFSQISNAENYSFGMFNLMRGRTYTVMDASSFFLDVGTMKVIQQNLTKGITQGYVIPLTRVVFPPNEVSRALRLLVEGKHRGRVVVRMNDFNVTRQSSDSRSAGVMEMASTGKTCRNSQSSLLNQIASKTGIVIPADVDDNATLETLGLGDENVKVVYNFMRDTYNLCYHDAKLKSLTVKRIKHLESMVTESPYQEAKGLENFFSNVESDELLATTEMVFLPTLGENSTMRGDEFDSTQTYLCIIPGLESHNKRFAGLCELLKLPAMVLQPGWDRIEETLPDMAQRYAEILQHKIGLKSNFYLMGYESGVLTALEIASILEENGLFGTIYCVGTTPEGFKAYLENELRIFKTEEDLQIAVVQHICALMGGDIMDLPDMRKYGAWEEKVQICVRALLGRIPHSAQYAEAFIKAAYARILQVRNYQPRVFRLRSQIVFIRASKQQGNLQMYSDKPVVLYDLKAPLFQAAADLRCSSIINRHLDRNLIEAFNEKDICDSYLTNRDTYMHMN